MARFYKLMLLTLALTACDNSQPPKDGQQQAQSYSSQGIGSTMAHAAVGGLAAGAGASAGHAIANKAMDSFSKRRRAKRIAKMRAKRR